MGRADPLARLQQRMRRCRACARTGHEIAGRPVFSGGARAQLMLIGQAPGATEAETGLPFSGAAGRRLFDWLAQAGLSESAFRAQQYMTSHPSGASGWLHAASNRASLQRALRHLSRLRQRLGIRAA